MNKLRRKHEIKNSKTSSNLLEMIISSSLFTLLFCIIGLIMLALATIILLKFDNPIKYIDLASLFSLYSSSLITGFVFAKKYGKKYVTIGLMLGLMIFALIFIISIFFKEDVTRHRALYRVLIPVFTIFGSILGIKREKRSKKRKHRR